VRLIRFADPAAFSARAVPFLVRHEAEHNLLLGITGGLVRAGAGPARAGAPGRRPYLALLEDERDGAVLAVAVRSPDLLVLSRIAPEAAPEALSAIAADLAAGGDPGAGGDSPAPPLPGVRGPAAMALAFAGRWSAAGGPAFRRSMAMRIYQLDRVTPVAGVRGALRPATAADSALVAAWLGAFERDIGGPTGDPAAVARAAARSIAAGGVHLWQLDPPSPGPSDAPGDPVSMANATGATPNGIRINMVYTRPEARRRGYASAAVAALSQAMLDAGRRFCFLFTDLSNPTTNRIYQTVGYRPVADFDEYRFAPPETPA
jgi:GNAT superfamily N-acetyltransferase